MAEWKSMIDGCLEVRPPLDEPKLAEVPARRGVVLLLSRDEEPITLISSADLRRSLKGRLTETPRSPAGKRVNLRSITQRICWKLTHSWFETDLWYFELARAIWPEAHPKLLSWRRAWFVHVDPLREYPHFRCTRDVGAGPGRYLGPFAGARSAQRFVQAVQDVFDLCRDYKSLVKSPHAQRCTYGQMGRCLSPCDGTTSMQRYRQVIAEAADFAAGARGGLRRSLAERMAEASDALEFERAAAIKGRLDRLGQFDSPGYRHIGPAEGLQFILVQGGPKRTCTKVFLADRGSVRPAGLLGYPLDESQLAAVLEAMVEFAAGRRTFDAAARWRIGLITHYLLSSPQRRGLILRWSPRMKVGDLSSAIEKVADHLKLRRPKPPGRRGGKDPGR